MVGSSPSLVDSAKKKAPATVRFAPCPSLRRSSARSARSWPCGRVWCGTRRIRAASSCALETSRSPRLLRSTCAARWLPSHQLPRRHGSSPAAPPPRRPSAARATERQLSRVSRRPFPGVPWLTLTQSRSCTKHLLRRRSQQRRPRRQPRSCTKHLLRRRSQQRRPRRQPLRPRRRRRGSAPLSPCATLLHPLLRTTPWCSPPAAPSAACSWRVRSAAPRG